MEVVPTFFTNENTRYVSYPNKERSNLKIFIINQSYEENTSDKKGIQQ